MSSKKEYLKNWAIKNKEKRKLYFKDYYQKNKKVIVKQQSEYKHTTYSPSVEQKQKQAKRMKDWYEKNRESQLEYKRQYAKDTRGSYTARDAKRRASKLQQTPKWADLKAIEEFYKNCPEGYHVDHIVPLQGKNVRGLHILENLQYLPAVENIRKSNKF